MIINAVGPTGVLLALANIEASFNGVSVRRVSSGRISSNEMGHGETSMTVCYIDGKRTTRAKALEHLQSSIKPGEAISIEGPAKWRKK